MESQKPKKRRASEQRRYMRNHARKRRKLSLQARVAAKIRILLPQISSVVNSAPAHELAAHQDFSTSVREKLHAANLALLDALRLADPSASDSLIPGTSLPATELRVNVLDIVRRSTSITALEIATGPEIAGRWALCSVHRTLIELARFGLVASTKHDRPGLPPTRLWSAAP